MAAKRDLRIMSGLDPMPRESPGVGIGAVSSPEGLPTQPTALLGRENELEVLSEAILKENVRLLTLTGPGGVGKTRLGIEVAMEVRHAFPDGAFFVDLAYATAPDLVPSAIAVALGLLDTDDTIALSGLVDALADQHLLLLLDNFDHVPTSASEVGEIVARCPQVTVIVTSRTPLYLRWEHVQPIAPLLVPDEENMSLAQLEELPFIRLFVQRAQAIRPEFRLTASNAQDVLMICRRLDGLPLAIELASARMNVLTPSAILSRLDNQESLLQQTAADVPPRHRSLGATVSASYSVLSEQEQSLLRRLAIFVDGFTLDAAAAIVAEGLDTDILEGLASLVDKSVVATSRDSAEEPRFLLLQTMDSYLLSHAHEEDDLESLRQAHFTYYLELAEQAMPELRGPRRDTWLTRLERERGNLEAAIQGGGRASSEQELRLAIAFGAFSTARGDLHEAIECLTDTLVRRPEVQVALRFEALDQLAHMLRLGNRFDTARVVLDEGLYLARSFGAAVPIARLLTNDALLLTVQGDFVRARARLDEALALWQELDDTREIAQTIQYQGMVELLGGSLGRAETLVVESLSIFQSAEDLVRVTFGLLLLARLAELQGNTGRAADLIEQTLTMCSHPAMRESMLLVADHVACLVAPRVRPEVVGRLLGAIDAARTEFRFVRDPVEAFAYDEALRLTVGRSSKQSIQTWMKAGEALTFDQMRDEIRALLVQVVAAAAGPKAPRADTGNLSKREYEVLQLVAQGLSNRQIAHQLIISENTAKFHVTSILNKLGADSRARIVAIAAQLNLLQILP